MLAINTRSYATAASPDNKASDPDDRTRLTKEHISASENTSWLTRLFSTVIVIALIAGWLNRNDNYIDAETGTGYLLGITGSVMMLVLLFYPLSKRIGLLRKILPMRYWFGFHMMLGILGPVLVLFHANFQLGSTNSNVALFCMVIIAVSGIAGRYFYTHIHYGLYGSKATLEELVADTDAARHSLNAAFVIDKTLKPKLDGMEATALKTDCGLASSTIHALILSIRSRYCYYVTRHRITKVIGHIKKQQPHKRKKLEIIHQRATLALRAYISALRKAAGFRMYERLFSYWHILHIPLFFMMLIAAIVHIFAVHIY